MSEITFSDFARRNLDLIGGEFAATAPLVTASSEDQEVASLKEPSAHEVAAALWRRETVTGNMVSGYQMNADEGNARSWDGQFNPYAYVAQHKEEFSDIQDFGRRGELDQIYNESELLNLADQIRKGRKDLETIQAGGVGGMALGMVYSLADVVTLIPVAGPIKKASKAYNFGRMATAGFGLQASQEVLMHQLQVERTWNESALNVAATSLLAGGIGAFAGAKNPKVFENAKRAIDPNTPSEPIYTRLGANAEESDFVGMGAAEVRPGDSNKRLGGTWLGDKFRSVTPSGRALQWTSDIARDVVQGIFDTGGQFTRGMADGRAAQVSAEVIKRDYLAVHSGMMAAHDDALYRLNLELGGTKLQGLQQDVNALTGGSVWKPPVDQALFDEIVRRKLVSPSWQTHRFLKEHDQDWIKKSFEERGYKWEDVQAAVNKATDESAANMQQHLLDLEDLMVKHGIISEDKRMGVRYGIAQLWNRKAIISEPERFREFLSTVIAKTPDEDWLKENYGMSLADFQKLPEIGEAQVVKNADGTNTRTPTKAEILRIWKGDDESAQLDAALQKVATIEEQLDFENRQFTAIARGMKVVTKEAAKLSNAEMRAAMAVAKKELELDKLMLQAEQVAMSEDRVRRITDLLKKEEANATPVQPVEKPALKLSDEDQAFIQQSIDADEAVKKAEAAYMKLTNDLPADNPKVVKALQKLEKARQKADDLQMEASALLKQREAEQATAAQEGKYLSKHKLQTAEDGTQYRMVKDPRFFENGEWHIVSPDGKHRVSISQDTSSDIRPWSIARLNDEPTPVVPRGESDPNFVGWTKADAVKGALERLKKLQEPQVSETVIRLRGELEVAKKQLANSIEKFERARRVNVPEPLVAKMREEAAKRIEKLDPSQFKDHIRRRARSYQHTFDKVEELQKRFDTIRGKVAKVTEEKALIAKGLKLAGREVKASTKELRKAIKELRRVEKKVPMEEALERIMSHYMNTDRLPNGLIQKTIGESGRAQDRVFHLTPEERALAEQYDFLHTDLRYVMSRTFNDMAGRLALREKFGTQELSDITSKIDKDYEKLIAGAKDQKAKEALKAERERVKKDVELGVNLLLGRHMSGEDMDNILTWGMSKLRQATFLRFVAGFPLSSMADLSATVLNTALGKDSLKFSRRLIKELRKAKLDPDSRELRELLQASEVMFSNAHMARLANIDDIQTGHGIGALGSLTNKVTTKIDKGLEYATARANIWSGQGAMTMIFKGVANMTSIAEMARKLPDWDNMSKLDKARFASVGIGRDEARELARFMKKYGEWDDAVFLPNAHKWHAEEGGVEAHRTLRFALGMIQDRGVITPGYGDMPRLAATSGIGKLLFQFQSYGFGAVNRFMTPLAQRAIHFKDVTRPAAALVTLFALTNLNMAIRAFMRGEDLEDYDSEKYVKEVIDRSGLLFYLSPYTDALFKLAGDDGSSRYRHNQWWNSLLGPGFSTATTAASGIYYATQGDVEKAADHAFRLMLFNQWFTMGGAIADAASN